jgi:hypothetical protein
MFCHGELARSRPAPRHLTRFYLCVAFGGALGGALVGLAAPALLSGYFEVEIGLVLLALAVLWRSHRRWRFAGVAVLLTTLLLAGYRIDTALNEVVAISRNFYGVLRIRQYGSVDQPDTLERELVHGRIMHGQQFLSDARRRQSTGYYTETSGIGRLFGVLGDQPLRVGLVGLGAGTLAVYGKAGDRFRFYEIDPAMIAAARSHFSFLGDSAAHIDVRLGDGRLLLQAEPPASFDVLVIDAFSGDSIPVHLLTREAVQLYRERLAPHGVIALHISNSHLELQPVVARIAAALELQMASIEDPGGGADLRKSFSHWVLLAQDRAVLDRPGIAAAASPLPAVAPARTWTDDYSNIVQIMSFGGAGKTD